MFELISTRRLTWRGRFTRAISLRRCRPLTRLERLTRAAVWLVLGGIIAVAAVAYLERAVPIPPVTLLDQLIEHRAKQYTVYLLRMEWRGVEKSCRLVVYHDRQTWSLQCEPR